MPKRNQTNELEAAVATAIASLQAIKRATIEGRVCDDVAWFDGITTLHDYCDMAIDTIRRQAGLEPNPFDSIVA